MAEAAEDIHPDVLGEVIEAAGIRKELVEEGSQARLTLANEVFERSRIAYLASQDEQPPVETIR
jgi:hypothetical protein